MTSVVESQCAKELEAAKSYCDLVEEEWSDEEVIWLQLDKGDSRWRVVCRGEEEEEETAPVVEIEGVSDTLSKIFFLTELKKKIVALGLKQFNVCLSIPKCDRPAKSMKWPGPLHAVKKLWCSPSDGDEIVLEQLINEVCNIWRDESVVLYACHMFSDFAVNVLFIVGHFFNKVGLVNPQGPNTTLLFYEFQRISLFSERLLQDILRKLKEHEVADLLITPDSTFHGSEFYAYYVSMCCIHAKMQVLDIVLNIENEKKMIARAKEDAESAVKLDLEEPFDFSQIHCKLPECMTCSRKPSSKSSDIFDCERLCDELKQLSSFIREVDVRWPAEEKNVIWMDFSGQEHPTLRLVKKQVKHSSFKYIEVSKFCVKQLLHCQRRLSFVLRRGLNITEEDLVKDTCFLLGLNENIETTLKRHRWSDCTQEVKVLEFGRVLWMNIEDHESYQIEVLQRIISALDDTWRNECLELSGFPLLSEFNVSLVFVLGHFFEKVGLLRPSAWKTVIFFQNFRQFPRDAKLYLEKALLQNDVLSLVPLKNIFSGEFYDCVRDSNNLTLKKQCLKMLDSICLDDEE